MLDMHGVRQNRSLKGQMVISGGQIILTSDFDVKLADHQIEVPKLVIAKIAETIAVKNKFILVLKKT